MSRKKHHNQDIEEAIIFAESMGWGYKTAGKSSHAWGRLMCVHAQQIKQRVKRCPHKKEG